MQSIQDFLIENLPNLSTQILKSYIKEIEAVLIERENEKICDGIRQAKRINLLFGNDEYDL